MNRRQLNYLGMYQSILSHLDKFPATWNQFAPIALSVERLRKIVAKMLIQSQLQAQLVTMGYTKRKNVNMLQLLDQAYQLSLKLRSYAKVKKDPVLLHAVAFSYSEVQKGAGHLLLQRSKRLVQHARDHLAELAAYQVTAGEIAALEQQLSITEPMTPARNVIAGARKTATRSIPRLIDQAREQLNLLDDLMEATVSDAAFVSTYFNLRPVYERVGTRSGKIEKGLINITFTTQAEL